MATLSRITEGEITSIVRRFYRANGFHFLSTSSSGEKLYYVIDGNLQNNKQPDSIVIKNDIIIICEDKIFYSDLFAEKKGAGSDLKKVTAFLSSEDAISHFREKLPKDFKHNKILGCLSSLIRDSENLISIPNNILNIRISRTKNREFNVRVFGDSEILKHFLIQEMNFDI